eukprot:TRINITY_DN12614_c0_g1_i1.p1 TRINITY_DN12614_c0_g1~~TRINITY_DN12614_c0_g1_i1.p1  ORF type:complete len:376 (+),score=52.49 TRINITY_DN12614_c0_g1_i1:159-1286(+)
MQFGRTLRTRKWASPPLKLTGGGPITPTSHLEYHPYHDGSFRTDGGLAMPPLQLHPYRTYSGEGGAFNPTADERQHGIPGAKMNWVDAPAEEPNTSWLSARPYLQAIITKTTLGVGYEGEEIEVRTDYFNYNNDVLILATPSTRNAFKNWQNKWVERSPELLIDLGRKRQFFDFYWRLFNARIMFMRHVVGMMSRSAKQPWVGTLDYPVTREDIASRLYMMHRIVVDPQRIFSYPVEDQSILTAGRRGLWYVFPEGSGEGCEEAVMDTEKVRFYVHVGRTEGLHSWLGSMATKEFDPASSDHFDVSGPKNYKKGKGGPDTDHKNYYDFTRGVRDRRKGMYMPHGMFGSFPRGLSNGVGQPWENVDTRRARSSTKG